MFVYYEVIWITSFTNFLGDDVVFQTRISGRINSIEDAQRILGDPTCPTSNTLSNCTFKLGDVCDPETFNQTICRNCNPPILCTFDELAKPDHFVFWLQWFNLFGFYWAMNFVTAYGEMVLAGVFAKWYWTRNKTKVPCSALLTSLFNTTFYHLGTIAFGSLIIAIIKVTLSCIERLSYYA